MWNLLLGWFPSNATAAQDFLGHTGAVLLGAGTALAVTTHGRARILIVPVAAAIAGMTPAFALNKQLGIAFAAAACYWWAARAGRLAIATAPHWRPHLPTPTQLLTASPAPPPPQTPTTSPPGDRPRPETDSADRTATPPTR